MRSEGVIGRHDGSTMAFSMLRKPPEVEGIRKNVRILVADDNDDLRDTICMVVEMRGYFPVPARDGVEGLQLFGMERFDVVVSDFHMPNMDGLALLIEIKKISPHTPVIIASAEADAGERDRLRAAGALLVLPKPFEIDDFEAAISLALSRH